METLLTILFITIILALIVFIIVSIYYVAYITKNIAIEGSPTIFYIKTLDGDDIINIDEIEQVTEKWSAENKQYEIVFYLKSGREIKEEFSNSEACNMRFEDIRLILNNSYC